MKLGELSQSLWLILWGKFSNVYVYSLCFQSSKKAHSGYHNESKQLEGSLPEPVQSFSRNWDKFA